MSSIEAARVALAFDDDAVRDSTTFLARAAGCHPLPYACGRDLLGDEDLDLIRGLVLEQELPELSGLEILRRLKDAGIPAPAILVTLAASPDLVQSAAALGVLEVIEGPILAPKLMRFFNLCRESRPPAGR